MYETIKRVASYAAIGITSLATAFTFYTSPANAEGVLERLAKTPFRLALAPVDAFATVCKQIEKDGLGKGLVKGIPGGIVNAGSRAGARILEAGPCLPDENLLDPREVGENSSLKTYITDPGFDPFKAE